MSSYGTYVWQDVVIPKDRLQEAKDFLDAQEDSPALLRGANQNLQGILNDGFSLCSEVDTCGNLHIIEGIDGGLSSEIEQLITWLSAFVDMEREPVVHEINVDELDGQFLHVYKDGFVVRYHGQLVFGLDQGADNGLEERLTRLAIRLGPQRLAMHLDEIEHCENGGRPSTMSYIERIALLENALKHEEDYVRELLDQLRKIQRLCASYVPVKPLEEERTELGGKRD